MHWYIQNIRELCKQAAKVWVCFCCPYVYKCIHYENMPIQVYWKFYHQKMKIFWEKILNFHISALNTNCGNSLEPPRRGGFN